MTELFCTPAVHAGADVPSASLFLRVLIKVPDDGDNDDMVEMVVQDADRGDIIPEFGHYLVSQSEYRGRPLTPQAELQWAFTKFRLNVLAWGDAFPVSHQHTGLAVLAA